MALEFFQQQYTHVPPLNGRDLSGQTVIITGASSGLGLEMARHVATLKPGKLIVTARNAAKMADAMDEITRTTGCDTITAWALDLDDYGSIKAFAQRVQEHGRVDILMCNAGLQKHEWTTAATGHETTLQANVYGTFLLLLLIAPVLKQTTHSHRNGDPARAIVVSSDTHTWVPGLPDNPHLLADLDTKDKTAAAAQSSDKTTQQMSIANRYPVSKLLEILFVRELVKHTSTKDFVVATANPGLCQSSLTREIGGVFGVVVAVLKFIVARSAETGARVLLYPALVPDVESISGRYFSSSRDYPVSSYVSSAAGEKAGKLLYDELIADLAKVDKRVLQVVS